MLRPPFGASRWFWRKYRLLRSRWGAAPPVLQGADQPPVVATHVRAGSL